jgi:hypothetical protein
VLTSVTQSPEQDDKTKKKESITVHLQLMNFKMVQKYERAKDAFGQYVLLVKLRLPTHVFNSKNSCNFQQVAGYHLSY